MADKFFAISRSVRLNSSAVTVADASTAAANIELRITTADAQAKPLMRKDVIEALTAFKVFLLNSKNASINLRP